MVRKLLPPEDVDGVLGGTEPNEKWKDLHTEKINGESVLTEDKVRNMIIVWS